ncbi:methionyl-tRNA formyltransferase [Salinisphaera sp. USBA-960]|uniref:methionyl-tRNA formyltransferase n=1 Tax=Salinisphaera orenii TaxID=856731 RepID=UPI000DBE96D2|nr:methionyl-tRNA formyltransferase [Salifodinibacter halophilus]NNC25973.1 methionyl-tRNA formyltransferase [Salifodinibacter halophilus]
MRIVFAGTPDFALPSLAAVRASGHELVAVVTQPDRPAGRGQQLTPSPVKKAAVEADVPVIEADRMKGREAAERLASFQPDLMVVVAYGAILGRRVLDVPRCGCVNIHGSLLPRWRGAAPIARALLSGDETTGVTLTWMRPKLDSGPIVDTRAISLDEDTTAAALHDKLATLGGHLVSGYLVTDCDDWPAVEQDEAKATYAPPLTKAEGIIDWSAGASAIVRRIRAMQPWPVAHSALVGDNVRVFGAHGTDAASTQSPGTVVAAGAEGIRVATGDKDICLTAVQFPGKKRMPAAEAARGRALAGQRFD